MKNKYATKRELRSHQHPWFELISIITLMTALVFWAMALSGRFDETQTTDLCELGLMEYEERWTGEWETMYNVTLCADGLECTNEMSYQCLSYFVRGCNDEHNCVLRCQEIPAKQMERYCPSDARIVVKK